MKHALIAVSLLVSSYSFAGSPYIDSLKKIKAVLSSESVIIALQSEAVKKIEIGGDDNLDVKITSSSCEMIVGLAYIISNNVVTGYKVENIADCR